MVPCHHFLVTGTQLLDWRRSRSNTVKLYLVRFSATTLGRILKEGRSYSWLWSTFHNAISMFSANQGSCLYLRPFHQVFLGVGVRAYHGENSSVALQPSFLTTNRNETLNSAQRGNEGWLYPNANNKIWASQTTTVLVIFHCYDKILWPRHLKKKEFIGGL
jgi:hypothetical protein